jgi:hypothetical protein
VPLVAKQRQLGAASEAKIFLIPTLTSSINLMDDMQSQYLPD